MGIRVTDIIARLDELLGAIRAALASSDLEDKELVLVDDDGRKVSTARSLRAGVIIVYPFPGETRPGGRTSRLSWTVAVAVDRETPRDSARRAQALIGLLRDVKILRAEDTAAPTDFELPDRSGTVPGYTITHIEEHRP